MERMWLGESGEMAQQVKAFATKHNNLSSIPGTQVAEGGDNSPKLFSDLCARAAVCTHPSSYTHK